MKSYGGFWVRFFASLLDGIIVGIPFSIFLIFVFGVADDGTLDIIINAIYGIYNLILPLVWDGYVIGKRIMSIQIQRVDGEKLTFATIFVREIIGKIILVAATLGLIGIISAFMVAFRKDKRAVHDLMAGTCIVKSS